MNDNLTTALALAVLCTPASALGGFAVFENSSATVGSVQRYDDQTGAPLGAPIELASIRLLPLDFAGRSAISEFLPGEPRLRSDIPGASRLLLPRNKGVLYRYSRDLPSSGAVFGFFHVRPDGQVNVLIEVPGTGALGTNDPFISRIAVAPMGDAFLCATTLPAAGNLLEVAVVGAPAVLDRTSNLGPLSFAADGLALTTTMGVGVSRRGVLRFNRSNAGAATVLTFAPDPYPAWFSGQVVMSRGGAWSATTAGSSPTQAHVYAFSVTGAARRATSTPQAVSGAGFLPQAADGPYLAVSDDGGICAWRTEGTTRECFLSHTQPAPGEAPEQLSSTQNFSDTLDEVGVFHFRPTGQLVFAVGERPTPPTVGIEKMDLFQATLPPGGGTPAFVNLSLSSGDATVPFTAIPQIRPERMTLLSDGSTFLIFDSHTEQILVVQNGVNGATILMNSVKTLDLMEPAGTFLALGIQRADSSRPEELYRVPLNLSSAPSLLASAPNGTVFARPQSRRDAWLGYVTVTPSGELLDRVSLPTGTVQEFQPVMSLYGPVLGISGSGSIVFSIGAAGTPAQFQTWPFDGSPSVTIQSAGTPGFVLPGS